MNPNRRSFHQRAFLLAIGALLLACGLSAAQSNVAARTTWVDLESWPLEGKGWQQTRHHYDRLPAKAEQLVRPPVWNLALDSAGLRVRFVTDAGEVRARWTVRKGDRMALPHMPATGVSG